MRLSWKKRVIISLSLIVVLAESACGQALMSTTEAALPSPSPAATQTQLTPTASALPATSTPFSPTESPQPTPAANIPVCTPLGGYSLQDLQAAVVNPYNPPEWGSDDPHQGVDIAVMDPQTRIALAGNTVLSVLPGRVAGVIINRFPYGNAVMVETPLDKFSPLQDAALAVPDAGRPLAVQSPLTCPAAYALEPSSDAPRSLYLIYAHLLEPPTLVIGDSVDCGQVLGKVGSSGNSLNPHLHLEARVGPAGSVFDSMAHYDASATQEEMAKYCLWRVSGNFELVDPMLLLGLLP